MTDQEIIDFFQPFFKFIHEYDEPIYEKEQVERLINELLTRFRFIAQHGFKEGKILPPFAGRVFLLYQNSSDFARLFVLYALQYGSWEGRTFVERGFVKFSVLKTLEAEQKTFRPHLFKVENLLNQTFIEAFETR